jgi:hypothetical protein
LGVGLLDHAEEQTGGADCDFVVFEVLECWWRVFWAQYRADHHAHQSVDFGSQVSGNLGRYGREQVLFESTVSQSTRCWGGLYGSSMCTALDLKDSTSWSATLVRNQLATFSVGLDFSRAMPEALLDRLYLRLGAKVISSGSP